MVRKPSALETRLRHLLHPLTKRLETSVHPLRYLFVELTQRCNLRCRHCGSDCGREPRADELSTDEWLDFFGYLGRRAERDRLVLVVTGGEPLCHPELDRLLSGLRAQQLAWGMVTNGYALSAANVARLFQHGISSITVSLDGLEADHDWLRGVPGAFGRAIAGIRRLAAAAPLYFDVVTCVNPRNLDALPQLRRLLQQLGVRRWRLFSIFPKGRARDNSELLLSPAQLRQLLAYIAEERRALADTDFQLQFSCEGYLPPELDREVRDEPYFCRAGINIASVLCDGAIAACPNITRSLVQGNVRRDDFFEVWEQRFAPHRDRSWMRQGPCSGCQQWNACRGNSLHLWDDEAQRPVCCTHDAVSEQAGP